MPTGQFNDRPEPAHVMFLVIANISKRCNIRSLIASAVAFGAEVLVGMST